MDITIRRPRIEEAAEITALIFASKQSNGYDDAFMAACADELRVSEADITDQWMWVAEAEQLLGCITLGRRNTPGYGEVSSFFVHPESKRRGVGKRLWQTAREYAQDAGFTHLQLDADPEAVAFYEAVGFRTVGQVASGSIPGRFLPFMEIDLTQDNPQSRT